MEALIGVVLGWGDGLVISGMVVDPGAAWHKNLLCLFHLEDTYVLKLRSDMK